MSIFQVKVVCETRDYTHSLELRELMFANYKKVKFEDLRSIKQEKPDVTTTCKEK